MKAIVGSLISTRQAFLSLALSLAQASKEVSLYLLISLAKIPVTYHLIVWLLESTFVRDVSNLLHIIHLFGF